MGCEETGRVASAYEAKFSPMKADLVVDGGPLGINEIVRVARTDAKVAIAPVAVEKM